MIAIGKLTRRVESVKDGEFFFSAPQPFEPFLILDSTLSQSSSVEGSGISRTTMTPTADDPIFYFSVAPNTTKSQRMK